MAELIWSAPEVLFSEQHIDFQKADIYSLGVIMKEVFTRSAPYNEYEDMAPHGNYKESIDNYKESLDLFMPKP